MPSFPLSEKMDVNGAVANLLWTELRSKCPSPVGVWATPVGWEPLTATDVVWNFEKILLDHTLTPVKRYASTEVPSTMEADIEKLLGI